MSIVSLMSSLGFATHHTFLYQAIQAESKQNLRFITTLYRSYQTDNDLRWSETGYNVSSTIGSWRYHILTTSYMASDCNYQNPFGFKIDNCDKNRFSYWIRRKVNDENTFNAAASLKSGAYRNFSYNSVEKNINLCNEICNQRHITNNGTGVPLYTGCADAGYSTYEEYMSCRL